MFLGEFDHDCKDGENWRADEEETLGPDDHHGEKHHEDGKHTQNGRMYPALPVPFCNRNKCRL